MNVSAEQIARALALIISNTAVYGPAHAVTRQSCESCFQQFVQLWMSADAVVGVSEAGLSVNQDTVELKNVMLQNLAAHLEAREISNFTLLQGTSREQFAAFAEVLVADPKDLQHLGGFVNALGAVGLSAAVSARKVLYREIADHEEVVEKAKLEQLRREVDGNGGDSVQTVIAFLHGDVEASEAGVARSVMDMGADADQLAELIMHAAEVRAKATSAEDGETLGDLVVGFLRRTYEAMTHDPSFQTQKTKTKVQRTLALLERNLLEKLQAMGGEADAGAEAAIKDAVEEMTDELALDALARDFTRKRAAAATSEKRVLRYLKHKGAADKDLKERLLENGLDETGWRELLVRSVLPTAEPPGTPGGGSGPLPGGGGLGTLAHLLKTIEAYGQPAKPEDEANGHTTGKRVSLQVSGDVFGQKLDLVRREVDRIVRRAERQIERLVEEAGREDTGSPARKTASPPLGRKRLFAILAEIGQELRQPLAVIQCAFDMIRRGSLGEVTALQMAMLDTAADSGNRIRLLIDRLIAISGLPDGCTVNPEPQASLYP